jgi:hypothetical protein
MAEMIRKQIYIHRRHQVMLKRLAKARSVSEAEVVRQAIEREAASTPLPQFMLGHTAWKEIMKTVEERKALGQEGKPYRWNREDAYEERLSRYDRRKAD